MGATSALTGVAWLAGEAAQDFVLPTMPYLTTGVVMLGFSLSDDEWVLPRPSTVGLAVGSLGTTVLHGINLLATYGTVAELRQRRARHRAKRASRDSSALERSFMDTDMPIGHFLSALPMLVGAIYAVLPAFERAYQPKQRVAAGVMGFVGLTIGHQLALRPNFTTRYLRTLQELDLELQAGPEAIVLSGCF